jgi:hypothetical protein
MNDEGVGKMETYSERVDFLSKVGVPTIYQDEIANDQLFIEWFDQAPGNRTLEGSHKLATKPADDAMLRSLILSSATMAGRVTPPAEDTRWMKALVEPSAELPVPRSTKADVMLMYTGILQRIYEERTAGAYTFRGVLGSFLTDWAAAQGD